MSAAASTLRTRLERRLDEAAPAHVAGRRPRGTAALPDGVAMGLELVADRRFGNGIVLLSHHPRGGSASHPDVR